jgi:transposase-like protein
MPVFERTRERLKAPMGRTGGSGSGSSQLVRLAARLIIEDALEGEAADALDRGHYARGAALEPGYRNGDRTGRLKSAEGTIEYSAPQIADRAQPFRSPIRETLRGRTKALEELAVAMDARGLSTRDIEALFADETGTSLLSRSAASPIRERLWAEYEEFAGRDLSAFDVVSLFVDGIAERLHLGQPREAVLAAWGILADGKKALLHLAPGTHEDTASCRAFFQDLGRRGLPDPLLVVSDGAPGIIRALEECFPRSVRQRCLAHKMHILEGEAPEDVWSEFKVRAAACHQAASPALAPLLRRRHRGDLRPGSALGGRLPARRLEACIAPLRCPLGHRRTIRTTNLLARLLGKERWRTKVIPHAFGERAVLKLTYAALIRAAERWRGISITAFELRQLKAIRDDRDGDVAARTSPATAATVTVSPNPFIQKGPDLT